MSECLPKSGICRRSHTGPITEDVEDILTRDLAVKLFRQDPERALYGQCLMSAETDHHTGSAILSLAGTPRFIELISHLSPVVQDILLQYYVLGKTYSQIGPLVFPGRTLLTSQELVKIGRRLGVEALCSIIQAKGKPKRCNAYSAMLKFQSRNASRRLKVIAPDSFGMFAVTPNGDLSELFAPSWSVLEGSGTAKEC